MAGYREHIGVSSALGVGYGAISVLAWHYSLVQGALAACLAAFAGMLPDLDAEGGKPVRELFGVLGERIGNTRKKKRKTTQQHTRVIVVSQ